MRFFAMFLAYLVLGGIHIGNTVGTIHDLDRAKPNTTLRLESFIQKKLFICVYLWL
jgi:hypothetical protein